MDAATALDIVSKVITTFIQVEPIIAQGWTDVKPFATVLYNKLMGGADISDADLAALEAQIDALNEQVMTPEAP